MEGGRNGGREEWREEGEPVAQLVVVVEGLV